MQAHILILGFVQGVGFRRFVKSNARKLDLRGWVKNLPDNRVEAVAAGDKDKLVELIKVIEKGSFFSEVKDVQVSFEEEGSFDDFIIVH